MKLYDTQAPNPRRARIFIAEKGLDVENVAVDLMGGENLKDDYKSKSPFGLIPALELDDGTVLTEVPAMCRYLEAMHPEPNLMGNDPLETARVEAWERFAEMSGMQAVGEYFRNGFEGLNDRGLPGVTGIPRVEALIDRGERRIAQYYDVMEERLGESEYVACDRYTLADITTLCVMDFANMVKKGIPEGNANTKRWYETVSARPGTQV